MRCDFYMSFFLPDRFYMEVSGFLI